MKLAVELSERLRLAAERREDRLEARSGGRREGGDGESGGEGNGGRAHRFLHEETLPPPTIVEG